MKTKSDENRAEIIPAKLKIKSIASLAKICAKLRKEGKIVVTTNGVFDILHIGHGRYLEKARSLGDCLIVGVNSDSSVRAIKGKLRPINNERDRSELLASLSCVDYACIFNDQTPEKLLEQIRPSVHVKGGDYDLKQLPEAKIVEKFGGKIKLVTFVHGYSTSSTIKKIIKTHG